MSDQILQSDRLEITDKTYAVGMTLERPRKTAKILSVSYDRVTKKFKGYYCHFVTTLDDLTTREQDGLLSIRDLEVPPERGGWKLRKTQQVKVVPAEYDPDKAEKAHLLSESYGSDDNSMSPDKIETISVEFDGGIMIDVPVEPIPEPTAPVDVKGQIEAFLSAIGIVSFFDVKKTADGEPGEWMFTTNLMTPGAVERRLSEAGSPSFHVEDNEYQGQRAWSAKAWFVPPPEFALLVVPTAASVSLLADTDLAATAMLIKQLRAELDHVTALVDQKNRDLSDANHLISLKDEQIAQLTETRDSAIEHDAAVADRATERAESEREQINLAHKRFDALHEEGAQKYGTAWLTANMQVSRFAHQEYVPEDMYGETDIRVKALLTETAMVVAALNGEIAALTERLAEGRAASAPILSAPAADVLAPRKQEVKTLIQNLYNRFEADAQLAELLNNEWEIVSALSSAYVYIDDSGDFPTAVNERTVTLTRICRPADPQPARQAATPVDSTMMIKVIEQQPSAAPMPPAEFAALPVNERKAAYAAIMARRDISWAEKRALLNDQLVAVGAHAYQAASAALAQPVRSLVEMAHD